MKLAVIIFILIFLVGLALIAYFFINFLNEYNSKNNQSTTQSPTTQRPTTQSPNTSSDTKIAEENRFKNELKKYYDDEIKILEEKRKNLVFLQASPSYCQQPQFTPIAVIQCSEFEKVKTVNNNLNKSLENLYSKFTKEFGESRGIKINFVLDGTESQFLNLLNQYNVK